MNYESCELFESACLPGVRVRIRRMSFGRRLDLVRALRDKLSRIDAALAAPESESRDAEATALAADADAACLRWAVESIEGLEIDNAPATLDTLIEKGPEQLVQEILARVRREIGLSEDERKNSESPSTSFAAGRKGRASDGSATPADVSASSAGETAASLPSPSIPPSLTQCGCGEASTGSETRCS